MEPWPEAEIDIKDGSRHLLRVEGKLLSGWVTMINAAGATIIKRSEELDVDGDAVAALWLEGNLRKIVQYNECDALTTYLVWLRLAHFAGHFTASQYAQEQALVRELVDRESSTEGREHLTAYREEWDRLEKRIEEGRGVARERSEVGR